MFPRRTESKFCILYYAHETPMFKKYWKLFLAKDMNKVYTESSGDDVVF